MAPCVDCFWLQNSWKLSENEIFVWKTIQCIWVCLMAISSPDYTINCGVLLILLQLALLFVALNWAELRNCYCQLNEIKDLKSIVGNHDTVCRDGSFHPAVFVAFWWHLQLITHAGIYCIHWLLLFFQAFAFHFHFCLVVFSMVKVLNSLHLEHEICSFSVFSEYNNCLSHVLISLNNLLMGAGLLNWFTEMSVVVKGDRYLGCNVVSMQ